MKASIEYCGIEKQSQEIAKSVERERVLWYPKRDRVYKLKMRQIDKKALWKELDIFIILRLLLIIQPCLHSNLLQVKRLKWHMLKDI